MPRPRSAWSWEAIRGRDCCRARCRKWKAFFFEKKKQKTFIKAVADSTDKSFLVLFFKKGLLSFQRLQMTIRIDRVVTRGGDSGQTSLGDGTRVAKDHRRVEAYGTVDEANAALGLLRLHTAHDAVADAMLARLQNDLFDIGADLCVPGEAGDRLRVPASMAERLEAEVADINAGLPPLTSFVLPGGTPAAAHAHLARVMVRRAERRVVKLAQGEVVNPEIVRALNRMSDLLFVLGRRLNQGDVLWVPGGG
jgi:cob(I)alamin adenosyltransferase